MGERACSCTGDNTGTVRNTVKLLYEIICTVQETGNINSKCFFSGAVVLPRGTLLYSYTSSPRLPTLDLPISTTGSRVLPSLPEWDVSCWIATQRSNTHSSVHPRSAITAQGAAIYLLQYTLLYEALYIYSTSLTVSNLHRVQNYTLVCQFMSSR